MQANLQQLSVFFSYLPSWLFGSKSVCSSYSQSPTSFYFLCILIGFISLAANEVIVKAVHFYIILIQLYNCFVFNVVPEQMFPVGSYVSNRLYSSDM